VSSGRRTRALLGVAGGLALACAALLAAEALREPPSRAWFELSAGLGLGSRAGVASGFFGYDARLESRRDGELGPVVGTPLDESGAGGLEFEPLRGGARGP
jgi:hypothetical protein